MVSSGIIKEFLKPGLKKIVIAILTLIFFPMPFYFQSAGCFAEAAGIPCNQYWTANLFGAKMLGSISHGPIISLEDAIIILLLIAASYLLSCIIVFIFSKHINGK